MGARKSLERVDASTLWLEAPRGDVPDLESVMSGVAPCIAVLSTRCEGECCRLAATSFGVLSLRPPAVVICVGTQASAYSAFVRARRLAINLLAAGAGMPDIDADAVSRDFPESAWRESDCGLPVLRDAFHVLECAIFNSWEYGANAVLVCGVVGGLVRKRVADSGVGWSHSQLIR